MPPVSLARSLFLGAVTESYFGLGQERVDSLDGCVEGWFRRKHKPVQERLDLMMPGTSTYSNARSLRPTSARQRPASW